MTSDSPPALVRIGQIVAAHGVRGQIRVYPLTDFPERWPGLTRVYIGPEAQPRAVTFCMFAKGDMPVLQLEAVTDRTAAAGLVGQYLSVRATDVQPLPPDTFYIWQLQGLHVIAPDGKELGQVVDVQPNPANDLLVIAAPDGRRVLVPLVRALVLDINLAAGRMTVENLPGLFS